MSSLNEKVNKILGSDNPDLVEFIRTIKNESQNSDEFRNKITELDVGLNSESIQNLYNVLAINDYKDVFDMEDVIQKELNLGVEEVKLIKDFIMDILGKSSTVSEFITKLNEIQSGLSENTIKAIYENYKGQAGENMINHVIAASVKKEEEKGEEEEEDPGLSLPNRRVEWKDLSDISDLLPKGRIRPSGRDDSPLLNNIYRGIVRKVMEFGCFVEILGTKQKKCDGLVHISEISQKRISDPYDVVLENDEVYVKVIKLHSNGKISLSMKQVDQKTGRPLAIVSEHNDNRGRKLQTTKEIRKRKLTSPERWEIQQLIASGAASIDDYPELKQQEPKKDVKPNGNPFLSNVQDDGPKNIEEDEEDVDVELNTSERPNFLTKEVDLNVKIYDMPKIVKVPKGSMNRTAMKGSEIMKTHREQKFEKKKEVEQQIIKKRSLADPTMDRSKVEEDIQFLKKQLIVTAWEKSRMRENITFGKRTSMPISAQRMSLPVFNMRSELIKTIRENQFVVIVGETGSGKTTQITQYLYEEGFTNNGIIGCTQPRRVAALSVAKRVAEEVGCNVGEEVGYSIRFDDKTSPKTKIKYMTDGMLQIETLIDPLLRRYSVIMLDEAHERTVATDILFALLKQAAQKRPELKIIVTSATLDSKKFSKYFLDAPVMNIPGKTFPVEVFYADSPQMDYIEAALDCVMDIHINNDPGDILVFLTGQEEIDSCCEILYERVKTLGDAIGELVILPVYSALPSEVQSKIFEPTPEGKRKVVFATNIAETSITIDGIYYVVDPGFSKVNTFNPRAGMEQLIVSPISQAQANQRKGRAGRTGPGKCYRLYTESAFYNEMLPNTIPEIQRQNLSNTILMLKAMGINDLLHFDFMDPPPRNLLLNALSELYNLQSLDTEGYITKLGLRMSQFPTDPTLSRSLLASVTNGCSDELITIIAMLSVQNVFYRPKDKQAEADNKKIKFHHPYGDHLTLLNVYNKWEQSRYSDKFCTNNFLHARHLKRARDVKNQIYQIFRKLNLPLESCHGDPDLIRKTLTTGFFINASKRDSQVGYKTIVGNTVVGIHPSSALYGKEYEYVIYHSLVLTSREYMSQVTAIDSNWLTEVAPHFYKVIDANSRSRKKMKIAPLHNKFTKDQNSWRLSSIRQSRERALGIKR